MKSSHSAVSNKSTVRWSDGDQTEVEVLEEGEKDEDDTIATPKTAVGTKLDASEGRRQVNKKSSPSRTSSRPKVANELVETPMTSSGSANAGRQTRTRQSTSESGNPRSSVGSRTTVAAPPKYSISELVKTLGHGRDTSELPSELERRVLDFRLAQQRRREKHGQQYRCGIYGMYAHLADVRIDLEWSEDAAWRRNNGMPYLSWSDFDAARNKGVSNRPCFTYFVVFLCTIMLVVEFGLNDWKVEPLNVNPLIGPSAQAMIDAGARDTPLIVEDGQWFRIFSPLFLHAGIIHFFVNMSALWFIGGAIEQSHGILNAMILFFVSGIGGNILSAIFLPQYISVGASGGIFGLVGGCIADIMLNWNLLFIQSGEDDTKTKWRNIGAIMWLVVDVIINMLIGFTPYVDNFSHLGGLTYGICCGLSTLERLPVGFFGVNMSAIAQMKAITLRFLGLIVSMILIVTTTVLLATMDVGQTFCTNCRYVSCVPFPFGTSDKWWFCDDCDFVTANVYKDDESKAYNMVELTCPNGAIEEIPIDGSSETDLDLIRKKLPTYCRQFCDVVKKP